MKGKKLIGVGILLVLTVAGALFFWLSHTQQRRAQSIQCGNQMSSIGFGARLWADEEGGKLPSYFLSFSNEISAPFILHCPADTTRPILRSWAEVTPENISYEIVAPGIAATNTDTVLFRCKVHGHLGYGDGTVFDGVRRRSKIFP